MRVCPPTAVSDLYRMGFNPVNDRHNFTALKDPVFYKQQLEEMHATEHHTFAPDVEAELKKLEACDLLMFCFPLRKIMCWPLAW